MNNICILHISDLHLSKDSLSDIRFIVKRLIEDVKSLEKEEDIKVGYVCFTGDLIKRGDNASSRECQLEIALDDFITPLLSELNLREEDFILVPGNHEVDTSKINEVIENGLKSSLISNDAINKVFVNMDSSYIERISYFSEFSKLFLNDAVWSDSLNSAYISKKFGISIGFACLNTAWRSTGSGINDKNKMILGEKQVQKAYDAISSCDIKIALMHHPTYWLIEEDKFACEPILNQFDIVLSGHLHSLDDKQVLSYGYSTIYSSSGCIFPLDTYYNGYSLLNIHPYTREVKIYMRKYYGSPRRKYDKSLFHNKNGYDHYQLNNENKSLSVGFRLVNDLRTELNGNINKSLISSIIDDKAPTRLEDIFVHPVLRVSSEYEKEKNDKSIELNELIEQSFNIMFIGKKETGKTTILHYIALYFLNNFSNHFKIPFIMDFNFLHKGNNAIEKLMLQFVLFNSGNRHVTNLQQLNELLSSGTCIILIDNLSIDRPDKIEILREFIKLYPKNRYIFTVYENVFNTISLKSIPDIGCEYKKVYIQTLTKNRVRNLTEKWIGNCGIDIDQFLDRIIIYFRSTGMPRTPLLVSMMLAICSRYTNFIPINEASIMERFMEILLEKLSVEEFMSSTYDFKNKEDYLSYLAWRMAESNKFYFSKSEYLEITVKYFKTRGLDLKYSRFETLFFDKNVLVEYSDVICFRYQCMVEYYIAKRIRKDKSALEWVLKEGNYMNFINEISYLTGLERDCEDILIKIEERLTPVIEESRQLICSLDEYNIETYIDMDPEEIRQTLAESTLDDEERDRVTDKPDTGKELEPKDMKKDIEIKSLPVLDTFYNTLLLYGKVIKNSEDLTLDVKSKALSICIDGYRLLLGVTKKVVEDYFTKEYIDKILEGVKGSGVKCDEELVSLYKDIVKITTPMVLQNIALESLGTSKLSAVLKDKIESETSDEFSKFMYVFLFSDLRLPDSLNYIEKFLKESKSKDIINLSLFKLIYYYNTGHYRTRGKSQLESIIADSILKLRKLNKTHKTEIIEKIRKFTDKPQKLIQGN